MREKFQIALTVLTLVSLVVPGVLPAYDYTQDENDVVLRITDEIDLTITGEIRTRYEWNDNLVDFTDDLDDQFGFVPSRARIGFRLDLPRDVAFYFEIQELFSFGEDTPARISEYQRQLPNQLVTGGLIQNYPYVSGDIGNIETGGMDPITDGAARRNENARVSGNFITSTHRDDLGLYQAYIEANSIGDSIFNLKAGRQELSFGNEWMLGNQDFYGGASYDALKGWWEFDRSRLDIFWSKLDEQNTGSGEVNSTDDDTDLYGVYFAWPEIGTSLIGYDLYGMLIKSNMDGGPQFHDTNYESWWLGARFYRKPEWGFHFNAEGTYQFGQVSAQPSDLDIEAWGFEGSLGYTWDVEGNPDLHLGFTYASGDDDPFDDKEETFAVPNAEIHPRLGFADLFAASNLVAWQIGYAGSWENIAWGVELLHFETAEEVVVSESELANEIDLWFSYQYSRHLALQVAYAYVSIEDVIKKQVDVFGYDSSDAHRFYVNLRLLL